MTRSEAVALAALGACALALSAALGALASAWWGGLL